ncbi:hypothetical protein [Candidatus Halobonum tyrrellensis]|uniref:Uncharacterized protein n=1 Tax=Candidatus Halobonum tyrrellensis G22 TaxID=1324957 RepID=V4HBW1_9EURY|nr:hypothetical protein [Candidatus Halobonum tyrrellensis]ESP88195.1 hypothetical protein K933_10305 [Candidatus Halobonum tyrrellensis G22]
MAGGYDSGKQSHDDLRKIRQGLERHPMVASAEGIPPGGYEQVRAELDSNYIEGGSGSSSLTVSWFSGVAPGDRPEFSFHYVDDTQEVGLHHHPNEHVDGWGHVQKRHADDTSYRYVPYTFGSLEPERVVWEVLSFLNDQ